MKPVQSRFARDITRVFGGQVAMTVIGVVTGIITARALGPADRGLFQLLTLLPVTLSNFAKFGIPQANVFFIRRKGASPSAIAANSVWLALGLGGALALICYVGRDWLLQHILKEAPAASLPPILALIPFVLMQTYFMGIVQAQERFREYNVQQVAPNLMSLIGLGVALLVLHTGLMGAVAVQVFIVFFVSTWLVIRVRKVVPFGLGFDAPLAKEMVGFGGKSYLQTLAATLHLRIDQYMMAYFLDPADVGLYAVAVNVTNLLLRVPEATGTVLFPRLAGADEKDAHAQTARVARHTLFLVGGGALGYAIAGPIFLPLMYGKDFAGAVMPMLLLLPGIVMMSLYLILTRNFTSRNRQEVNILAAALALGINITLNWLLIPWLGVIGAAISSGVSYTVASTVLLVAFVRESDHGFADVLMFRRSDLGDMLSRLPGFGRAKTMVTPKSQTPQTPGKPPTSA